MKNLFLLLLAGGVLAYGISQGRIQSDFGKLTSIFESATPESLLEGVKLKQAELHAIRSGLEKAQRGAPYCGGEQMKLRIHPKTTERIATLEKQITDLRKELSTLRSKQTAAAR